MTWTTTNILKSKLQFQRCIEYNTLLTSKSIYLHDHECALGIWKNNRQCFLSKTVQQQNKTAAKPRETKSLKSKKCCTYIYKIKNIQSIENSTAKK